MADKKTPPMMPLDEEGGVTVSPPTIRPEFEAAADRRLGGKGKGGGQDSGRFPPIDMRKLRMMPRRMGPPNPNSDLIPDAYVPGSTMIYEAQAGQPSRDDLLAMAEMIRQMEG